MELSCLQSKISWGWSVLEHLLCPCSSIHYIITSTFLPMFFFVLSSFSKGFPATCSAWGLFPCSTLSPLVPQAFCLPLWKIQYLFAILFSMLQIYFFIFIFYLKPSLYEDPAQQLSSPHLPFLWTAFPNIFPLKKDYSLCPSIFRHSLPIKSMGAWQACKNSGLVTNNLNLEQYFPEFSNSALYCRGKHDIVLLKILNLTAWSMQENICA